MGGETFEVSSLILCPLFLFILKLWTWTQPRCQRVQQVAMQRPVRLAAVQEQVPERLIVEGDGDGTYAVADASPSYCAPTHHVTHRQDPRATPRSSTAPADQNPTPTLNI